MKYIICPVGYVLDTPIVFPEFVGHDDMALRFVADFKNVSGAGFCYQDENGKFKVYGESRGLGIKSKEIDAQILNRAFKT